VPVGTGCHMRCLGVCTVMHRMSSPGHSACLASTRAAAIIPAWNEAATVGAVVYAAIDARLTDEVIVVDNASSDATANVAATHGARVVHEATAGKGEAMRAGVAASDADVIVFLDADLVGLRPHHVDGLVASVIGGDTDMACGLFDRGPVANPIFLEGLPVLTGQRALRRELFEQLDLRDVRGYRVEAALNSLIAQRGLRRQDQVLPGLWHRTKEEKLSNPVVGFVTKLGMLASACWSYTRFALAHRPIPAS
jgi:glycosyltransferase involved in cell wall biosynthesis